MEPLDLVEDVRSGVGACQIVSTIDAFALEHPEEAFDQCVVGAAAHRTHATDQIVPAQEALVLLARELTAAIGVQQHRIAILSLPQRHEHRLQYELAILNRAHRPADDESGVKVDHHAQVQPALRRPDEGDIRDPFTIRRRRSKVSSQVVLNMLRTHAALLSPPAFALRNAFQARPPASSARRGSYRIARLPQSGPRAGAGDPKHPR